MYIAASLKVVAHMVVRTSPLQHVEYAARLDTSSITIHLLLFESVVVFWAGYRR